MQGEHQHFVTVPWSPHGVFASSPVATEGAPTCGFQLIGGFLADPEAEPDTTCLADLLPPFVTEPQIDARFFGGLPAWDNPAPSESQQLLAASKSDAEAVDTRAFVVRPLMLPQVRLR
ncbi:MAG TPA: hypothetical protein VFN67_27160 [Polyangiales bacterium]|nr:hypothetical protein [Polyangiales bacterium]